MLPVLGYFQDSKKNTKSIVLTKTSRTQTKKGLYRATYLIILKVQVMRHKMIFQMFLLHDRIATFHALMSGPLCVQSLVNL